MKSCLPTKRTNRLARSCIVASPGALMLTLLWCSSVDSAEVHPRMPRHDLITASSELLLNNPAKDPTNAPDPSGRGSFDLGIASIPHGIVRPFQRATMSAPLPGVLMELQVKSGDPVKQGQILAVMDNRIAMAAVRAAEAAATRRAQIEHSKHALALAESLLARQNKLKESQAGAEFELEQARVQRDQAKATLASAMETQLQAERNLALEQARAGVSFCASTFRRESGSH